MWLVILCIVLIIFAPLCVIWALNTLFLLGIAFTFKTWVAVIILAGVVGPSSASSK